MIASFPIKTEGNYKAWEIASCECVNSYEGWGGAQSVSGHFSAVLGTEARAFIVLDDECVGNTFPGLILPPSLGRH